MPESGSGRKRSGDVVEWGSACGFLALVGQSKFKGGVGVEEDCFHDRISMRL